MKVLFPATKKIHKLTGIPKSEEAKRKMRLAKVGYVPWNKGKKLSRRHRLINSECHKGLKHREETKIKIGLSQIGKPKIRQSLTMIKKGYWRGDKNPAWKGGISDDLYPIFFNSFIKRKVRKRDSYICQVCRKIATCVHHIDYNKKNCDIKNLITLCNSCHAKTNFNRSYWLNYFNENFISCH